jgi:Mrp family chromosome partitioning ATPase
MNKDKCESDSSCQTCSDTSKHSQAEKEGHDKKIIENKMRDIRYKFMVISGKGGVGKSSVTVNLSATLTKQGYKVGILDADIHGPNIPKMLGAEGLQPLAAEDGMLPIAISDNLRVMSMAFFLQHTHDAVIWRGPMKHSLLKQFLGEVNWGVLDYLMIDLPPGTGDEALSVVHLIKNVDGAIVVTTPQDVALLDSRKAVTFARQLRIPLVGVVENMGGFNCPYCHKPIDLFKKGGGERAAKEMSVPFLGRIPIDPEMVSCGDKGTPLVTIPGHEEINKAFTDISDNWRLLLEGELMINEKKKAQAT